MHTYWHRLSFDIVLQESSGFHSIQKDNLIYSCEIEMHFRRWFHYNLRLKQIPVQNELVTERINEYSDKRAHLIIFYLFVADIVKQLLLYWINYTICRNIQISSTKISKYELMLLT